MSGKTMTRAPDGMSFNGVKIKPSLHVRRRLVKRMRRTIAAMNATEHPTSPPSTLLRKRKPDSEE